MCASYILVVMLDCEVGGDEAIVHPLAAFIRGYTQPGPGQHQCLPVGWSARKAAAGPTAQWLEQIGATSLHALVLPTPELPSIIEQIATRSPDVAGRIQVAATGGGAIKFRADIEAKLNVDFVAVDELKATVSGWRAEAEELAGGEDATEYPALICNVGTGVSLVRVDDAQGTYERVSGSGIGGATFWGLVRRLTQFPSFDDAVCAARQSGDPGKADMLVGDIYGAEASAAIGLPPDLVAGFLGKLGADNLTDADVSAALLRMVASNLGQLAVFQARLMGVATVWFTGGFVMSAGEPPVGAGSVVRHAVAEAVSFWSANKVCAKFPHDAQMLGALGAAVVLLKPPAPAAMP
ncbi:hypothetical protein GGI04_002734 [Coemansia thaxteri]|uniref:Uncharacterized protein n=1 Tax=Coemansia thaxteri TaxID=2663907 RepID=A0A9W8BCE7_9FUNG|nr:hypothetical protein H4R26_002732 [Coemansia thaxteri]KAJ2004073.1 hypothetical protein GGI04_002734 [Coemansia thaxteri]KAJ2468394.1 hypothetical protein GGI02_003710 [Coemansia sp. RSA 2322]KAJ2484637.1 hypothetical protein EV174_002280 [Coemansia sp. RSA 2320]